ncbi:MAG: 23S rRNA (guanosine(2251)-2'-O)-methyltransferase RlmB [Bacteroidales bacterium]
MTKKTELIFGIHPMLEALESGQSFDKIMLKKGISGNNISKIKTMARAQAIPTQYVPQEKLNRFTTKNHQGVIGLKAPIDFQDIEMVLPGLFEQGKTPFILILDEITDIRNFGAISRTAEAANVDAIVIPFKGSASITSDAMKTSAGALNYIQVCRSRNLKATCEYVKNSGLKLLAATEKAEETYDQQNLTGPVALLMGSEGHGISSDLLEYATHHLRIPLSGHIASLNVSVAAGILIYEIVKQRKNTFKKI